MQNYKNNIENEFPKFLLVRPISESRRFFSTSQLGGYGVLFNCCIHFLRNFLTNTSLHVARRCVPNKKKTAVRVKEGKI